MKSYKITDVILLEEEEQSVIQIDFIVNAKNEGLASLIQGLAENDQINAQAVLWMKLQSMEDE